MKPGMSLLDLEDVLGHNRATRKDFVVNTEVLLMKSEAQDTGGPDYFLTFPPTQWNDYQFRINSFTHAQISDHLGIPRKYYDRLLQDAPGLLCDNVNHWFHTQKEKRLVRVLKGKVRAFLSARYRPLDNYDLVEWILPVIRDKGLRIVSCDLTETKLYIKAVSETVTHTVPRVGDVVQAGICISNSEVGCGSLTVEPLIYTLRCTNGLVIPEARFRKTHIGRGLEGNEETYEFYRDDTRQADDLALWLKVRDTVAHAFDKINFALIVERMGQAAEDVIYGEPVKVVEVTQKLLGLRDSERNGVLKHLLSAGDLTRYGLLNAVTQHSQEVEDYDRASTLEKLGGYVLALPKKDWKAIAEAA